MVNGEYGGKSDMNENELFREATLRICRNLEIEEALRELLLFLKEEMPVSRIFLQHYDADYHPCGLLLMPVNLDMGN